MISTRLSYVLRHAPQSVVMTLDGAGWGPVEHLLTMLRAHGAAVTRAALQAVVSGSDTPWFAVSPDGARICASPGHSVPVDLGYAPAVPPGTLDHGTTTAMLPAIRREGLHRGRRHHVHLRTEPATAQVVGSRRGPAVVLMVDAATMQQQGHCFRRSANGVWLVDAVPPAFLTVPTGAP